MGLQQNIFVYSFPRIWPLNLHALTSQTQSRLHCRRLQVAITSAGSFDAAFERLANGLLLSLTVAINQTILDSQQDFAPKNDVKSVVMIPSRADFIAFPQKHVFHLTTKVSHFVTVQLLGNFLEKLNLFENLVKFMSLFFLYFFFALVYNLYNFLYFIKLAEVQVFGALADFLGLRFRQIDTHIRSEVL
jgi:hypothetical protein